MLGEVPDADIVTDEAFTFLQGERTSEELEEGGFARAVGTDEDGALAAFGLEVKPAVDGEIAGAIGVAVGVKDVFEVDDAQAAADGLGEGELNRAGGGDGGFDFFHAIDLLEFALGLGGFAGFGAEAVGKLLEGGDFLLLIFESGKVLGFAGGFFENIFVVVTAVPVEFGLGDFNNGANELIKELAVVGNHENGARVVAEIFLKPDEGLEVEVIGGFVEEEKIGFLDEEASEMGAHDPAPTEGFGLAMKVSVAKSEAAQNLFGAGLELPAAELGEGVDGLVVLRVFQGAGGFMAFDGLLDAGHCGRSGAGQFEDGFFSGGGGFLGEKAEGDILFESDAAVIGGGFAEDEGKKGGFAGAVGPDKTDAVFPIDLERDIAEERATGERFTKLS